MTTDETRSRIVATALDEVSLHGLTGLSIGELAAAAAMSKSGLYAHFGSKETLELAVVHAIVDRFQQVVWHPHRDAEPGADRLRAILPDWKRWVDGSVFPGGCPIVAASADLDDRPGAPREVLASAERSWLRLLAREFAAVRDRARPTALDKQAAFELRNNVVGYGYVGRFLGDPAASQQLDDAFEQILRRVHAA